MDSIDVYCDNCKKEVKHNVIKIKEGEDCWLSITVKCPECGKEHIINLYC